MPKGVYQRPSRTAEQKLSSLSVRLEKMSEPIPVTGCVIFTGTVDRLGYGSIALDKAVRIKAHRAAYMVAFGAVPEGMDVCHKCDVRSCINPEHLWVGSHQDNMTDMVNKGRARNGWRSGKRSRQIA